MLANDTEVHCCLPVTAILPQAVSGPRSNLSGKNGLRGTIGFRCGPQF